MTNTDSLGTDHLAPTQMPDGLRQIYFGIRGEVWELNARWIVFRQLFASGDERITLLNSAAPAFFSIVHDTMRDCIFLSITRLTDRPIVAGKETLSLSQLLAHTEQILDSNAAEPLRVLLRSIEKESESIRSWRNTMGAHNDLRMYAQVHPAPTIMFDSIGIVLRLISDFLNGIGRHIGYDDTEFAKVVMQGDGDAIVRSLERSSEHRECRMRLT